jgi:hypothetical protein
MTAGPTFSTAVMAVAAKKQRWLVLQHQQH